MSFLSSFYPQPVVAGTTEGTFAEGNHSHELDELDASGISSGKVLTANGLDAASWEDPTGEVEEAPEDGIIYGRKDADWVDITEPANLQIRRGTESEVDSITPLEGEPVWETDTKILKVGDGVTVGGISVGNFPLKGIISSVSESGVIDGTEYFLGGELGKIQINEDLELRGYDGDNDITVVAGNPRGQGAIDLQMVRTVATQVASGGLSVVIGGRQNTASGGGSVCISGLNLTASGLRSLCIGGSNSVASGVGAIAICGSGSGTVAGDNSIVLGDGGSTTSGATGAIAVGAAIADRAYVFAKIIGSSVFSGRSQSIEIGLKAKTTSVSATEMTLNGTDKLTIPSGVALFGTVDICAIEETNATEAAHYVRKFAIQNVAGTTSLIGTVTTIGTDYESDAGYDVSITADNTGDFLKIEVTGDSSKTLRWLALVRGVEIGV